MEEGILHVISHTDLDGITAAAVAWHANRRSRWPIKVTLCGYGEVDSLVAYGLSKGEDLLVLDLFCQRQETVDMLDRAFDGVELRRPLFFDHHKSTMEKYGNRSWLKVDTSMCAAKVYYSWLLSSGHGEEADVEALAEMRELVETANDRDLWLGERPESRLWQALVTLLGPHGALMRLSVNRSHVMDAGEERAAREFVTSQDERFKRAISSLDRRGDLAMLDDGILEFGDVSDFCGLVLDRMDNPPEVVAVLARRQGGDWAVSMRSRSGLAGRMVALLKDGRKVRGGGHDDAAALYFPAHFSREQIFSSLAAAMNSHRESSMGVGMTIGDILKGKLGQDG
ncbi:putative DHD superfamily phosphohydrolase [Thermanaerovibrio velox DSM 12556]|uniref:Putative DHD superfamily phosphohydrolase n=1 Tax=Thermanaerovibrio velox DSM 12556 TaxID=926567 RepID=H0URF9_9BACT|nr:phosphohydrolase [Thermanaerovibrio velox]EHM10928.1 putative DHD superfamily phosphohydrolase [Thermanaerovibrio velox DSM 12556]